VCADITEVVDRIRQGPGFDDPWDRTDCGRLAAFKKAAAIDEQAGLLPHLCDRSPLEIAVRRGLG
jgi:hypothetical protein